MSIDIHRTFKTLPSGDFSAATVIDFQEQVLTVARACHRDFPWRLPPYDPYHILISEIMLQQTQVGRVQEKFKHFLQEFPTIETLANASLRSVLTAWSGLGYNRRGAYLQQAAQKIVNEYGGKVPCSPTILQTLPGVGPNTAGSIAAFAYQLPTVFIETNIRTVFLHTCFPDTPTVHDKDIMPLIAQTIHTQDPRSWYYGLMDYGVILKKSVPNPNRRSKQHTVQSRFEGSDRQLRGAIIRHLTQYPSASEEQVLSLFPARREQSIQALKQLLTERLVIVDNNLYRIGDTISATKIT